MFRAFWVLIGAILACAPLPAAAEPFTVDALLKREAIGQASIDPSGRWAVFERLRPLVQADSFEFDYLNRFLRSDVHLVDLSSADRTARRLVPSAARGGRILGGWSPSGRRLLIYQLQERTWTAGIVDMQSGAVRWLDVIPELTGWGRTVQWRSDDELIMIVRSDDRLPFMLRGSWELTERLPQLWATAREGRAPSRVELGSGRFRNRGLAPPAQTLVSISVNTGAVRVLGHARYHDLELSPDGRRVAAATLGKLAPIDPAQRLLQSQSARQRTLHVFDLADGHRLSPVPGLDLLPNLLTWSQDSQELLAWVRRPTASWTDGALARIDVDAGETHLVALAGLTPMMPQTGLRQPVVLADWWDNEPVLYASASDGRADWYRLPASGPLRLTKDLETAPTQIAAIDESGLLMIADQAVWRVDRAGTAERVTVDGEAIAAVRTALPDQGQRFSYNNAPRRPSFVVRQGSRLRTFGIDGATQARQSLAVDATDERLLAISPDAALSVLTDDRYVQSLRVHRHGSEPRVVAQINAANAEIAFARRRAIEHPGPPGEELTSWLYLPANPSAIPPPLVVMPYPGSSYSSPPAAAEPTSDTVMTNAQVLAGAGYAVLIPSLPRPADQGEPSKDLADQVLTIVDIAAMGGEFDPDRLGLWGHSFGAHAALSVATQTSRFCAIVAASGIYDLASSWGTVGPSQSVLPEDGASFASRGGWVETGQAGMGAPPWGDPDRYIRNSPYFWADRITAPILLITADFDYSSPEQSEAMFAALHRQAKDAVLLTYFGDGHVLESPANIRDMVGQVIDWFDLHLKGRDQSGPASSPVPGSDPGLDRCQGHDVPITVLPDQSVRGERTLQGVDVKQALRGETAVEEMSADGWQFGVNTSPEIARALGLRSSTNDPLRKPRPEDIAG